MHEFLQNLYDQAIGPEHRLAIATLPAIRVRHFSSLAEAVCYAQLQAATKEFYYGVGLANRKFDTKSSASDIIAIPGLWGDIDCIAPWRNDKPLPRDQDEARQVLPRLPVEPTLLVHSGYGLHAYWLFKEPWIFGDEERAKASQLAKGWHGLLKQHAASLGWRLENLGDLFRLLRLPGGFHRKGDQPREVRVIEEHPQRRYNPGDFEDFAEVDDAVQVSCGNLVLRSDAEPPPEKFAELWATSPAFQQAWTGERPDLADQSQSGYERRRVSRRDRMHAHEDRRLGESIGGGLRAHGSTRRIA